MKYTALIAIVLLSSFSAYAETVPGCKGAGSPRIVESRAQLISHLASVPSGTTLLLKPGKYGNFDINRPGIFIAAENLAVVRQDGKLKRASSNLSIAGNITVNANNTTICGLSFQKSARNVTTDGHNNLKLIRNSVVSTVFNGSEQSFFLTRVNGLTISENILSAYPPANDTMAYGIAVFYVDNTLIKENIFDGVYDHQLSLKRNNGTIRVEKNRFIGCGHVCLQVGQTYDFDDQDTTSRTVKVINNKFEPRYTSHIHYFGIALAIQNANDLEIENNEFGNGFTKPIHAFYVKDGGYLASEDRKIGNYGINARRTLIKNNNFASGRLMLEGRGTGSSENITLNNNTGSANCKVTGFQKHGVPDAQIDWETIDADRPTVVQTSNGFHCS